MIEAAGFGYTLGRWMCLQEKKGGKKYKNQIRNEMKWKSWALRNSLQT